MSGTERTAVNASRSQVSGTLGDTQLSQFARFQFHQLVALMELRRGDALPVGKLGDPSHEYLRFRGARSLSFGPSDVSAVAYDPTADLLDIRVNFFGLYGPASPLPATFTERIIEADTVPSPVEDFLDLFNHRLISLLHVIWRKYRYYLRYETGATDPLSKRFLALCGFPIEDRDRIGEISRSALLPHLRLISLFSNSSEVVGATLSNFFAIPCRIEEFIPRKVRIGQESRLTLGQANSTLAEDAILGFELDDDFGKFRICIGQASFATLQRFLPCGAKHQEFCELLVMATREPLEWELQFSFEPETILMAQLGECRLGWTSWLYADDPERLEDTILLSTDCTVSSIDMHPAAADSDDPGGVA
ncbi:type VI secretion system baseplate subunit TssG [Rhizobium calliandrae]|uniref:Type VI secretion system baseplate subunit TssG n=1 Tax=Rhizobium calliandrae TaxID=1312182 RepID=A0ABT7KJQ8_9HYPH|nr:type VI secretion system baseplate subunit TssG [Rhizobium calliandrae]MDL2408864.1 type VI secretion system baseplate subunit TssG [Rhizobium calliandrae]